MSEEASNLRDSFLRTFKKDFKANLKTLLKKHMGYGKDLLDLKRNLRREVTKVYAQTDMHSIVTEEGLKQAVISIGKDWLEPIVDKYIKHENTSARMGSIKRKFLMSAPIGSIKHKFLKRSFLASVTRKHSPPKTATKTRTASKNTMNMGALSRALNDIF